MADLEIKNLHAKIGDVEILKGVNLEINKGEVHALMGPNGSGKSTLSSVIMGHPDYEVTEGDILLHGESILEMAPEERAKAGLFLCFQYPVAVPGVSISSFLKKAMDARHPEGKSPSGPFLKEMRENMAFLEMDPSFANRGLNEGFSGGEKKRMEILQMMMFKPGMVIMDETDSGLDIDALRIVSKGVNKLKNENMGLLVITHYERILTYIAPDHLHILMEGRVVMSGGPELVKELEEKGYDWVREQSAVTA